MRRSQSSRHPGFPSSASFTLIELLVVVAIIALLASIILPVMGMMRNKGAMVKELHAGKQIMVAYHGYTAANNNVLLKGYDKNAGEVAGTNKKPWRQKGTGRARAGSFRSPLWRGGGVVFGPRACDYTKKVSKTTRKLALRRVLGDNIRAGSIKTLESFAIADGKTQSFVTAVAAISTARRILIIADSFDDKTYLAARNVQNVLLMTALEVNVEHIMLHNDIFVVGAALTTLAKRTA